MLEPQPPKSFDASPGDLPAKLRSADRLGALLTSLPKWLALAVLAWQIRLSVEALSGRTALASLLTRFDRQTSVWELVCWFAALAGILVGIHSRYLLHRQRGAQGATGWATTRGRHR